MIQAETFRYSVKGYDIWLEFVFELLFKQPTSVMAIVEEVTFHRMDVRIAFLLKERGRRSDRIHMTHQEIAAELGSSREVISRIMEDFSPPRLVEVLRGMIRILVKEALQARSIV